MTGRYQERCTFLHSPPARGARPQTARTTAAPQEALALQLPISKSAQKAWKPQTRGLHALFLVDIKPVSISAMAKTSIGHAGSRPFYANIVHPHDCSVSLKRIHGCGSKIGTPNGTLVSGHLDQNLRFSGGLILTHTHMFSTSMLLAVGSARGVIPAKARKKKGFGRY